MIRHVAVLGLLLGLSPSAAAGGEPEPGKALHAAHCLTCHGPEIYQRPGRLVTDLPSLRERVQQCQLAVELLWFEEEVEQVTAYLNANYYHFGD